MAQGMERLDNGTKVFTGPGAAFGTDALLLARFAMPRRDVYKRQPQRQPPSRRKTNSNAKENACVVCHTMPCVRANATTQTASTVRNKIQMCIRDRYTDAADDM